MTPFAVILPAAGHSSRFGRDKLLEPLGGKPLIMHALATFLGRDDVALIVIPTSHPEVIRLEIASSEFAGNDRIKLCAGGEHRAHSVRAGLACVPEKIEWIAVHDAARPLIASELICRTFEIARQHGAAAPALPMHLTIKQATGPLPAKVARTVPRHELWAMQTPQFARRADLIDAFERCPIPLDHVTDDVQLLELAGKDVWLVRGDERNVKITTQMDLHVAEMMLKGQA